MDENRHMVQIRGHPDPSSERPRKGCKNFGRVLNPDKGDPGFGQKSPKMALHKKTHMRSELNIVKVERLSCILNNYVPLRIY